MASEGQILRLSLLKDDLFPGMGEPSVPTKPVPSPKLITENIIAIFLGWGFFSTLVLYQFHPFT